jgi:hypothetical protein
MFLKNWITTGVGIVALLISLWQCYEVGASKLDFHCIWQVLVSAGFVASKQINVTGGTVPQTKESVARVAEDTGVVKPL